MIKIVIIVKLYLRLNVRDVQLVTIYSIQYVLINVLAILFQIPSDIHAYQLQTKMYGISKNIPKEVASTGVDKR